MTSLALRFLLAFESASDVIFLVALCGLFALAVGFGQSSAPRWVTLGTFRSLVRARRAAEHALGRAILMLQAIARHRPQAQPGVLARGDLAAQLALEVQSPAQEAAAPAPQAIPAQEAAPPAPQAIPAQEAAPPAPPAMPAQEAAAPTPAMSAAAAPIPAQEAAAPPPSQVKSQVSFWVFGNYCYVRRMQRIEDDALFRRYKAKMEELGGFFLPPDQSFELPVARGLAVQDALVALGLAVVITTEDKLPVAFKGRHALVRLYAYLRFFAGMDPQGRVVVTKSPSYLATAMARGRKVADECEAQLACQRAGLRAAGPRQKDVDGGYVRRLLRDLRDQGYVQFEGPKDARTYVLVAKDAQTDVPPAVAPTSQTPEPTPPTVDPASDPADPASDPAGPDRINRPAEAGSTVPRRPDQPSRVSSDHDHHRHDHLDDRGVGPSPGGGPPTPVAPPSASGAPPPSDAPQIHLTLVAPQGRAPEPLPNELTGLGLESVVVRFHGQGSDVLRRVITAARRVKWKMAQGVPIRNFPGAVTSAFLHPQDWDVPAEALRDPAPPKAKGSDPVAIQPAIQPPIPPAAADEPAPEPAPDAPPLWREVVKALAPAAEGASPIAMWASMAHCTSAEGGVFRLRGDQFLRDQLRRPEVRAVVDRALAAAGAAGGRIEWEDSHA